MKIISKKIRASARGADCQVRIPSVCNFYPETTVAAHVGVGGTTGGKPKDTEVTYCCNMCHDLIDGRTQSKWYSKDEIRLMALEGAVRTREILLEKKLITVAA